MLHKNENSNIVKGRISVVLRGRDLKFLERSEKNNILRKRKFSSRWVELRKNNAGLTLELGAMSHSYVGSTSVLPDKRGNCTQD